MVVDDLRGGILGSSLFAGCNNDDPVTPDAQPEIVFAKESLDVPAEGGPFQIEYTIENPVANATLSAKCNDSWITDIDTKTAGVISFNVTKNETAEKREAIIEVSYADIQPAPSFKVKQTFPNAQPEIVFAKRASMFRPKEDLSNSNTRSKTPSQMRPCLPNATTVG